jgi:hypothetical protein
MLPSFRLIVVTFLFGFVAVFAGLRIAAVARVAHDTVAGLATQATAAPMASLPVVPTAPMTPIADAPVAEPPSTEFTVPIMFNLDSVISVIASAPAPLPIALDSTPAPAAPVPELAPLTLLSGIALQSEAAAPVEADMTPTPAELAPLTLLPGIALQSPPEAAPDEPPPAVAVELPAKPEPAAAEPVAAVAPGEPPQAAEITGSVEPTARAAPPPAAMDAMNQLHDGSPVTVWIRLPVARPPLPPKAVTERPKRPRAARPAAESDPFNFFSFGNSQGPF